MKKEAEIQIERESQLIWSTNVVDSKKKQKKKKGHCSYVRHGNVTRDTSHTVRRLYTRTIAKINK